MIDSETTLKSRLRWVKHYQESQNAALTCRRCGISKAPLLKWWRRYQNQGESGLVSKSRRPHKTRERKVTPEHEKLILEMRRQRQLGPKGLQRELLRLHQLRFPTRTIWKILHRHGVSVLKPHKRRRQFKRYPRPVPGDRVQIDTCKVGKNLYQFTAIDDCTRMRVLALYSSRSASNSSHFVENRLLKEFPFPIQRIQSDRGGEFIAEGFQDTLRENHIKFRPNRPRAPHLISTAKRGKSLLTRHQYVEFLRRSSSWASYSAKIRCNRPTIDKPGSSFACLHEFFGGDFGFRAFGVFTP